MAESRIGKKRKSSIGTGTQAAGATRKSEQEWTFLTNHAHALLCITRDPEARMRDVAQLIGITERAVQRIVSDLEEAGYVERVRDGRRNRYKVWVDRPLRHPIEQSESVSSLIDLVRKKRERRGTGR